MADSFFKLENSNITIRPDFIERLNGPERNYHYEYFTFREQQAKYNFEEYSSSIPEDDKKIKVLVFDRLGQAGGLFEIDFSNVYSDIINNKGESYIELQVEPNFIEKDTEEWNNIFEEFKDYFGLDWGTSIYGIGIVSENIDIFRPIFYKTITVTSIKKKE